MSKTRSYKIGGASIGAIGESAQMRLRDVPTTTRSTDFSRDSRDQGRRSAHNAARVAAKRLAEPVFPEKTAEWVLLI